MQMWKSLDKAVAVAGGCVVFAAGGGSAALAVGTAGSAASIFGSWWETQVRHGPENQRVLARARAGVSAELSRLGALGEDDLALLEGADHALGQILLDCIPEPRRLVTAFEDANFAKAAAAMVLDAVAARDDLFAEQGERAEPLARRFASIAIEAAMESALTDRDYFAGLLPWLLGDIRHETANLGRKVDSLQEDVALLRASAAEAAERDTRLLAAFESTASGQRAKAEVRDSRPFVVLARRINQEVDDPGQALTELTSMVEIVLAQQRASAAGSKSGESIDIALGRIAEKSLHGEFEAAAREAEGAFAEWQARETERRLREARGGMCLINANIEQNLLRRDAESVARWLERKVALEGKSGPDAREALLETFAEWHQRGERRGTNLDLAVAAAVARRAVELSAGAEQRWAALNCLGSALRAWGERESAATRLDQAVAAFRAALRECSRKRFPLPWAGLQNNLGIALAVLGERERGTAILEQAVGAYRLALEERRRDLVPSDWAMTQNNLGNALAVLGTREKGSERLEEAVRAFRDALEELTRDRDPAGWAATQNNLGNVLSELGDREESSARLEEAVAAHRAALEERPRAEAPLEWAMSQMNLGSTLRMLGERDPTPGRLQEAVSTLKSALEENSKDRVPLEWATGQNNLGNALAILAQRQGDLALLREATVAFRAALEQFTREQVPLDWAMAQNNLATSLCILGQQGGGKPLLEEGVRAYREVLKEWTRERVPLQWATTLSNLGNALSLLGRQEWGTERLEEASACYRQSLEVRTRDRAPLERAATQVGLAFTLGTIAVRKQDPPGLREALATVRDARHLLVKAGHEGFAATAAAVLAELERYEQTMTAAGIR